MIERYSHEAHLHLIRRWLTYYNTQVPPLSCFSPYGYCVDEMAIGFLFKPEKSKQCYIDHIVANPYASRELRDECVKQLFVRMETDAAREGYLLVTCLAAIFPMKKRLELLGWDKHGEYTLYFKTPVIPEGE